MSSETGAPSMAYHPYYTEVKAELQRESAIDDEPVFEEVNDGVLSKVQEFIQIEGEGEDETAADPLSYQHKSSSASSNPLSNSAPGAEPVKSFSKNDKRRCCGI